MFNLFNNHLKTPLGGLNNKNYLINYYNNKYVLKIPNGNKKDYSLEKEILSLASEKSICPKVLYHNLNSGILITKYLNNSEVLIDTAYNDTFIKELGKTLRIFHSLSCKKFFNPFEDIRLNINYLIEKNYKFTVNTNNLLKKLHYIESKYKITPHIGLCHNDLNPSNILFYNEKVYLIDFEYSAMGDIFFDLGMYAWLLEENIKHKLIESYFGFSSEYLLTKLYDFIFIAKFWNALWSIKKSLEENHPHYDFEKGGKIILKELENYKIF